MASTSATKTSPPVFNEETDTWTDYKKELEIWKALTTLEPKKQGPALYLQLQGKAKDAVRNLEITKVTAENGITEIMNVLDELYNENENQSAYLAYSEFENFKRPSDMTTKDYIAKFEALNGNIRKYKMELPDGVLAYRLLNSANLNEEENKLCRATLTELRYDQMKAQLIQIFGDKVAPGWGRTNKDIKEETDTIFYGKSKYRGGYNGNRGFSGRGRGRGYTTSSKPLNPPGPDGKPSRCAVCGSKYHWAKSCPDSKDDNNWRKSTNVKLCESNDKSEMEDIVLFQSSEYSERDLKSLLGETIGCGVIDSGCSRTVTGRQWIE